MRRFRNRNPWPALAFDAMRLGLEAQQVMALRLWAMAPWSITAGGARGRRESHRMVIEKTGAFAEAAMAAGTAAMLGGSTPVAIRSGMRKLRRRVRANRSRLLR